MKLLRWLLALSLAANLALLALVSLAARRATSAAGDVAASERNAGAPRTEGAAPAHPLVATGGSAWADLRGDDLAELVARLRAAGFPPKIIRAIVSVLLNERFAAREQALFYITDPREYWKQNGGISTPKQMAELTKLDRERTALMKQLLGPDWMTQDDGNLAYFRRQYGELPAEKIARMQELMSAYADQRGQITPGFRSLLPDEVAKVTALEQQMHADLGKLVTPAELEQYDLRASSAANYLRYNLSSFGASEAEYRAIFAAYQPFADQYLNNYGALTPPQEEARSQAEKQLLPAIAAALGPDRFADYQQATDNQYRQLNQLVARLDLPIAAAREVAAVQQDIAARATTVRNDATLAADQRDAQLAALAQEAGAKISAQLGPTGLEAYKIYGGQWLQKLAPPPPKN